MEELLQVGVITSAHGIRGEVKVFPTTDDAQRFRELKDVMLDTGKETLSLEIEGVKFFKQFVIVKDRKVINLARCDSLQKSIRMTFTIQIDQIETIDIGNVLWVKTR